MKPKAKRRTPRSLSIGAIFVAASLGAGAAEKFPDASELKAQPDFPEALVMQNGKPVKTQKDWFQKRRPELLQLFQHYMYGTMPPAPKKIKGTVERVDRNFFDGKATKKEITIVYGPTNLPPIHVLLVVPNKRKGPVPAFVGLNFCGNHTLVSNDSVALPTAWMPKSCPGCSNNVATESGRGAQTDVWALEQSIDRGYAIATFYNGDIEPDRPDAPEGIRAQYIKIGKQQYDWGAVAAWAWGCSRVLDYLAQDKDIDAKRVGVVGHSRNGKAALVAAAFDERFALAIPLQAGCGGTAPSRGKIGESVKQINDHFPHWFNAEFKKFNEAPERLPFDQHLLIALCAPRPVLLPNAVQDTWANWEGQFAALQAADKVYRFLG
ncbi:MAG TPA: acetylxylan esterase, partial [Verrucomicrobiae bacterium]